MIRQWKLEMCKVEQHNNEDDSHDLIWILGMHLYVSAVRSIE